MIDLTLPKNIQLSAAEKTFRDIFNYSSDLIYIQDLSGTFIDVNQTVLDKYGYRKEEIIGKTPDFLGAPGKNDIQQVAMLIKLAWDEDVPKKFEWWGKRKDGTEFLKEVVIRRGRYFDKEVIIANGRDITERKEAEERIIQRNKELKKVNSALDAFVYSASHDLKAPLSSMKGLLDLMKRDDPANAPEYISRMETSIDKLNQFVYDLVDYSRNAKMDLKILPVKINEKVKLLINELKYSEEAEGIMFDLQLNAPAQILSDSFRLRIILSNLISNSIRYHDKQKNKKYIIIRTAVEKGNLILEVIDNGIGIAEEHHEKIFEIFYRANEKNRNGSGLGLFMVKEAVELMKGKIKVSSTENTGTKMTVSIPING